MIILQLLLSLFISITRPDFIGVVISMGILIIYKTTFNREPVKNINRFLLALGGNIVLDLFWILMNLKVFNLFNFLIFIN
jgi:hypothetical protein